jgi:IS5 family transposase
MRFLNLNFDDRVPDAKTIWLFRDELTKAELTKTLFEQFDSYLRNNGFAAKKGQIIDASIVSAPKQRNTREENKRIKEGEEIEDWDQPKRRQKDTDARWTKKNNSSYFGYKNHVATDVKYKFIRDYEVTDASVHDSQVFEQLLDPKNSNGGVWADSAYRSEDSLLLLEKLNYYEHLQRKGTKNKQLTEREKQGNRTRSKIRSRIEHIFGIMAMRAGNLLLRCVGLERANTKIGLRNLSYNLANFARLKGAAC